VVFRYKIFFHGSATMQSDKLLISTWKQLGMEYATTVMSGSELPFEDKPLRPSSSERRFLGKARKKASLSCLAKYSPVALSVAMSRSMTCRA